MSEPSQWSSVEIAARKEYVQRTLHIYVCLHIKGGVYTVWVLSVFICMSLRVFLFAKKMKFLTKVRDSLYFPGLPLALLFYTRELLVELTEHGDSAANIIVHSMYTCMYCCIHSTY